MNNPIYWEIFDFYNIIRSHRLSEGLTKTEAMAEAYDAIELRFGIGWERSRAIIRFVNKQNDDGKMNSLRGGFYVNNIRLIELITEINDDYKGLSKNTGGK